MDQQRVRQVMDAANAAGLTVGGQRVTVTGARLAFAKVTVADGPLQGFSAEYAWETVERLTAQAPGRHDGVGHAFKPYADHPDLCVAELPESGDTCNRARDDHEY